MRLPIIVTIAALALAAAPDATAARWKPVTDPGAGIDQVAHLRTADGVLHVAWHKATGPNAADLLHTRIEPDGSVGPTTPIATGWTGFGDPALVAVPEGIRAFWGAIRSTDSSEPNRELNTALSTDGGATWTLTLGSVVPAGGQAYASDVSAATLADGTTLQAWAGTLGTWVHAGLDPSTPNSNYQAALGPYGYLPGLAADSAGAAMMAWFSSAAGHVGVLAQAVGAAGAPAGPVMTMPGTQGMIANGTVSRTAIVARAGGGFYVAYPVGYPWADQIRLWRVGASRTTLIARAEGNPSVTVAPDPAGRLWVVWSEGPFGGKRVLARRSNRAVTRFGVRVSARAWRDVHSVYSLDASATSRALDVLARFGTGTTAGGPTFVKRFEPKLTLRASPSRLREDARRIRFRVTDAGDPVPGATVRAGGQRARTDAAGRATLTLSGRAVARARKDGYAGARLRLP